MGSSNVRSALAFSFAERYITTAFQFITVIVLARLLTPKETGIYSVAVAITAIAHRFRDFGAGAYLIQAKDLTEERLRTTFTVSLSMAIAVAAGIFLSREWVAAFYGEPQIATLLAILTCNFLVIPFGGISLTLLRREMNFRATAFVSVGVALVYSFVATGLAYHGLGPQALAWASLAGAAATSLGAFWFRPLWRGYIPSFKAWREVASFGGYATLGGFASELNASAPDLIVGRMLGFHQAGILSRATGLISMFPQLILSSVAPVALSALAQRLREGKAAKKEFITGMQHITALSWSFYAVLAILADEVIAILFGPQWLEAGPLLRILCIGAIIAGFGSLNWVVLQAAGAVRQNMAINVATLIVQATLIAFASIMGIAAVATAVVFTNLFSVLLAYRTVNQIIEVDFWEVAQSTWKSMLVACAGGAGGASVFWVGAKDDFSELLLGATSAGLCWAASVVAVRHPLAGELVRLLRAGTNYLSRRLS